MQLQSIENAARRVLLRVLVALFGKGPRPQLPNWRERPYRVLVIRDDGIGDLIVSIEVLRAIAEASPTITLKLRSRTGSSHPTMPFLCWKTILECSRWKVSASRVSRRRRPPPALSSTTFVRRNVGV